MERALEDRVWQRALSRCEYCQGPQEYDRLPFEIDHIIALKHRGPIRRGNLCLACFACNNHKGPNVAGVAETTKTVVKLVNPRRQNLTCAPGKVRKILDSQSCVDRGP